MRYFLNFFILTLMLLNAKPLTQEEAFDINVKNTLEGINFDIKLGSGIFLYDNELKVSLVGPKNIILENYNRPKTYFKDGVSIIDSNVSIFISHDEIKKIANSDQYIVKLSFQGCSEDGLCYAPISIEESVGLSKINLSEQSKVALMFTQSNFLLVMATFLGFGVLLSLTPCVFPMIPILSSIIMSKGANKISTKKSFLLSLCYVLGVSSAYGLIGVIAGLFGANLQTSIQSPIAILIGSFIFIILALSMFGLYDIKLPNSIQAFIDKKTQFKEKKGIIGVYLMGLFSALLLSPCVAAPLAGALIYIGQTGSILLGGIALFVMGIGMGIPLLMIGLWAGKLLPKPGIWMDTIKNILGFILLGMAIWVLERLLPTNIIIIMYSVLIISISIFLGAFSLLPVDAKIVHKIFKIISIIILIYGATLFVSGLSGGVSYTSPLSHFSKTDSFENNVRKIEFKYITTLEELFDFVKKSQKPVMVDVYAKWCVNCIALEEKVFTNPDILARLNQFELLKIDITNNTKEDKEFMKYFQLYGPPGLMFFVDQKELRDMQIVGFINVESFAKHLDSILN